MAPHTVKIRVYGRVQGVFFRYHTQVEAQRLSLKGWVRNCHDGSVETLLHGSEDDIRTMISWLRRGPESAQVKEIVVADNDEGQILAQTFEVRY
jgi:acylphosphatase